MSSSARVVTPPVQKSLASFYVSSYFCFWKHMFECKSVQTLDLELRHRQSGPAVVWATGRRTKDVVTYLTLLLYDHFPCSLLNRNIHGPWLIGLLTVKMNREMCIINECHKDNQFKLDKVLLKKWFFILNVYLCLQLLGYLCYFRPL